MFNSLFFAASGQGKHVTQLREIHQVQLFRERTTGFHLSFSQQWRIQNFPSGGANPKREENLLFDKSPPSLDYIKTKTFEPKSVGRGPFADKSANALLGECIKNNIRRGAPVEAFILSTKRQSNNMTS